MANIPAEDLAELWAYWAGAAAAEKIDNEIMNTMGIRPPAPPAPPSTFIKKSPGNMLVFCDRKNCYYNYTGTDSLKKCARMHIYVDNGVCVSYDLDKPKEEIIDLTRRVRVE